MQHNICKLKTLFFFFLLSTNRQTSKISEEQSFFLMLNIKINFDLILKSKLGRKTVIHRYLKTCTDSKSYLAKFLEDELHLPNAVYLPFYSVHGLLGKPALEF